MNVEVLKHASGARHCHSLYQQVIGVQTLNQVASRCTICWGTVCHNGSERQTLRLRLNLPW